MGRRRAGQVFVEWHGGDHWDIRFELPDGNVSRRECQPTPSRRPRETNDQAKARALDEAKNEARRLKAIAWRGGWKLDTSDDGNAAPRSETLDTWAYRWLAERTARGLTSAHDDEGRYRKWIFPHLGHLEVATLARVDLERFVESLDGKVRAGELSWRTARHVWGSITKMMSDACRSKKLDLRVREDNPAKEVRGPDGGASKAKSYLYPEELLAVVSCPSVPLRWRRLFALSVYTYTRPGELEALEWGDVDFQRSTIHIHRAIGDDGNAKTTKTMVTRRIPIEPALLPLLETLKAEGGDRIVPSMPPETDLSKRLRDYLKRAGVTRSELYANDATRKQIRFYDLRATGITWMAIRGDERLRIMQRAGHKEFSTTMGYVREAETLGYGGEPFPALPSLVATEPENPSTWAKLRVKLPNRIDQPALVSMRNEASSAGFPRSLAAVGVRKDVVVGVLLCNVADL